MAREFDLVVEYKDAKAKLDDLKEQKTEAQKEFDRVESELLELMSAEDKETTATYEGVGKVTVLKPIVRASYDKENESEVFDFIRESNRDDIIKVTVHPSSLSSFVKECIEIGRELPEKIKYYLQPKSRFYPK